MARVQLVIPEEVAQVGGVAVLPVGPDAAEAEAVLQPPAQAAERRLVS
jgi:hypothetical protein